MPLEGKALRRLREFVQLRCPGGLPPVGSAEERERLLVAYHRAGSVGQWAPGLSTPMIRKQLDELGEAAARLVEESVQRKEKAPAQHVPKHTLRRS